MVRKAILFFLLGLLWWGGAASHAQGLYLVEISPSEVQQGRTAVLRVLSPPRVTRAEVQLGQRRIPLYRTVDGDWVGLLPAELTAPRGENTFELLTWIGDEQNPPQREILNIVWGGFLYQDIVIPNALAHLLDPELNRGEESKLEHIYSRYSPEKLWQGALQYPVGGMQISEFGGIRTYNNGTLEGRHTGVDFRAGLGDPIQAAGNGRVVFANMLPIRGNHVVIDHGVGVLTGYSHLSEIYVVPGQRVAAGEVIGAAGTTGRSQGTHAHFELTVNGAWVDATQFLQLTIPEAAPLLDSAAAVGESDNG